MLNSKLLIASGLLTIGNSCPLIAQSPNKPNILIILADDAGYNDFGFMGSKDMYTPNIDALSRQGVVFTDGHVAATVSSPSRACLITGRYGHRFGYECNLNSESNGLHIGEKTFGDIFGAAGYRTAVVGKWHLGYKDEFHPNRRGFDYFYGMKAGHRHYFYDENTSDRSGDERNLLENDKQVKFEGYLTDVFTDKAISFMNESSEPFMLYLSYNAVHTPMQAAEKDMKLFEGHPRRTLAAMTYALDRGVGNIVKSLKESGKFDNTIIFFLSDNGGATTNTSSNYPLKGFKGNKFEGGHRVPFFMVWNGHVSGGKKYNGLVSSLDMMATSVDAADIPISYKQFDGVSLLPYIINEKKGNPHDVLYWRKMDTRAVRQGDYKLIMTFGVDTVLYNLRNDPAEMNNLMDKEPDIYRKLQKSLSKWEKKYCVKPLWIEEGWSDITNGIHRDLMSNKIKEAKDMKHKK